MNNREYEKLLLQMICSIYQVVRLENPDVNHISMYSIDGGASITAFKDSEGEDSKQVFDLVRFADGSMHLSDGYYKPDGSFDFGFREVGSHDN